VLGGLGIGSVWGWLLVVAAAPALNRFLPTGVGLGIASIILAAGVYWLAGSAGVEGFVLATFGGAMAGVATRAELERIRRVRESGGRS
jgi:hypothetical protein